MITLILCAAGSGKRTGSPENKVLRPLGGKPVLLHALEAFAPYCDEILVPCREEDEPKIHGLLLPYPAAKTVRGGKTRAESVCRALKQTHGELVLVHDAARPFVTPALIERCIECTREHGSGICALPVTDTIVSDGQDYALPSRDHLFTVQTPQGFFTRDLLSAYESAERAGSLSSFTDDSGVYAKYIAPPRLLEGERANKKLTYAEDFPPERIGFGVDTHAFGEERADAFLVLGGVKIPSSRPLLAHSDGDVLVHALMDALLSAIGERDIGFHFPDADPAYKDADSMVLLGRVTDMVWAKSLSVKNASLSVLAETPRLSPYIEAIKTNLCAALRCPHIGVAAGTNEKLGYVGEGRGITAFACVLLEEI